MTVTAPTAPITQEDVVTAPISTGAESYDEKVTGVVVVGNCCNKNDDTDNIEVGEDEYIAKNNSKKKKKKKKKNPKSKTNPEQLGDVDEVATTNMYMVGDGNQKTSNPSSNGSIHKKLNLQIPKQKPTQRGLLSTAYTDEYVKYGQTDPPTIPVELLFQQNNIQQYPCGDIQYDIDRDHYTQIIKNKNKTTIVNGIGTKGISKRVTEKEMKTIPIDTNTTEYQMMNDIYTKLRLGGEIHRQVRNYTQSIIQPGILLSDVCTKLENMNRTLCNERGIERGIAFPTGCSINHVAAHYTPNTGDTTTLQYNDVMKVDFGVQIDGYIIDSAWTVTFNDIYDPLTQAVQDATEMGIRTAGIDQRLCDIGAAIQEVMESYEIELNNKTYPIRSIRNLNGHSIGRYQIHASKSVPIIKNACEESLRMEEYELYAIETFGSTGRGYVVEDMECSHYMKVFDAPHIPLRMTSSKKLLSHITKTFGTLAFCRRWLDRDDGGSAFVHGTSGSGKQEKYMGALKNLCDVGIVQAIPPLCDVKGCYTAQYEHTFMIQSNGKKEIFSRGTDY